MKLKGVLIQEEQENTVVSFSNLISYENFCWSTASYFLQNAKDL